MKRVKVLIPFHDKSADKDRDVNDVFEVSDERLAEIKAVNINMVLVLGDAEPKAEKKTTKRSKKENA